MQFHFQPLQQFKANGSNLRWRDCTRQDSSVAKRKCLGPSLRYRHRPVRKVRLHQLPEGSSSGATHERWPQWWAPPNAHYDPQRRGVFPMDREDLSLLSGPDSRHQQWRPTIWRKVSEKLGFVNCDDWGAPQTLTTGLTTSDTSLIRMIYAHPKS